MLKRAFSSRGLASRFGGCCISFLVLESNWKGLEGASIAGVLIGLPWHTLQRGCRCEFLEY